MDYPYGIQLAVAPLDENNVIRNGEVWIYDANDLSGSNPLALTDLSGLPLVNPLRSNAYGNTRPFITTSPQVKWKSGTFEGLFESYAGMLAAAQEAARLATNAVTEAALSAQAAADAESLALAPTDAQVDAAVRRASRPSNLALAPDGVPYILPGATGVIVYESDTPGDYYFTTD